MKLAYYPGCTLKTKARHLEDSAIAALAALDCQVEELPRWNCCGAVSSLAADDLLHMLAPVRDLIRAKESGHTKLMTLCSMCYNTLARANLMMRNEPEKRDTLNTFMEEEIDYQGEVEVVHLLSFLAEDIGWDKVRQAVRAPLKGLKVAPYYGCTLGRPSEVAIAPGLMESLFETLGATVVHNPAAFECCGAYQVLTSPSEARVASQNVAHVASSRGAQLLALSCPLCDYNVGQLQRDAAQETGIPTVYFTQLLALALGVDPGLCRFDLNRPSTRTTLAEHGLVSA